MSTSYKFKPVDNLDKICPKCGKVFLSPRNRLCDECEELERQEREQLEREAKGSD